MWEGYMNRENAPAQIRLGEDGELLVGFSCTHCGHINLTRLQPCEQCGTPFPRPSNALRARLEALRQSEGKKKSTTSQPGEWISLLKLAIWIYIFLVLLVGILMFLAQHSPLFQNACGC